MTTTAKIAITFLGAGGALGLAAISESPTARQALAEFAERARLSELLTNVGEHFAANYTRALRGDGPFSVKV